MVYWNKEFETYEYTHPDGYVDIFRDDIDAIKFTEKHECEKSKCLKNNDKVIDL